MNTRGLAGIVHHHKLDELENADALGALVGAVCGIVFAAGVIATIAAYFA